SIKHPSPSIHSLSLSHPTFPFNPSHSTTHLAIPTISPTQNPHILSSASHEPTNPMLDLSFISTPFNQTNSFFFKQL
ncbi:hypothetical protein, partial [Bacillus pumilus]|uniref:hypothetical protein n=1 Tax=Bacillus pumilus TaxID=1408 RepID=UPI001C92C443